MHLNVYEIANKRVIILPQTPLTEDTDIEGDGSDATAWIVQASGASSRREKGMPTPEEVVAAFTIPVKVTVNTPISYLVEKL